MGLNNKKAIEDLSNKVSTIEDTVTTKLMAEIEPSLAGMKSQIEDNLNMNLRRIVQEELSLREMKEKSDGPAINNDEKPENKNNKIQKKYKKEKPKKKKLMQKDILKMEPPAA